MKVQIYMKNEPLEQCGLLIIRAGTTVPVPAELLGSLKDSAPEVCIVEAGEDLGMKSAIEISAYARKNSETAIQVACPDKAIQNAICSLAFKNSEGRPVKCAPASAKPAAKPAQKPKVANLAKPKPQPAKPAPEQKTGQPASADVPRPEEIHEKQEDVPAPEQNPGKSDDAPGATAGPGVPGNPENPAAPENPANPDAPEASLVKGDEVDLEPGPETKAPDDPVARLAGNLMKLFRDKGIPSGQVPSCIDAVRESIDPAVTLPMQVRLKLAKDGAMGEMPADETVGRIAPVFSEAKEMIRQIDAANKEA